MSEPSRIQARESPDFLGIAALATALLSALCTTAAVSQWQDIGKYRSNIAPQATEGSVGFSLNFDPWLLTLVSVGFASLALVLLAASCLKRHMERQAQTTFLHAGTLLTLFPLIYLLAHFVAALF